MNSLCDSENYFRYEFKFSTRLLDYRGLEMIIRFHPAMFYEVFPQRYVNSLYLESIDFKSYNDNLGGLSNRTKHRIRWYGDLYGMVNAPVLEAKIKRNDLGIKRKCPLPEFYFDHELSPSVIKQLLIEGKVADPMKEQCISKEAVVGVRYLRKYFLSQDKKFRITIDWGIEFYGPKSGKHGFIKKDSLDLVILELKFDQADFFASKSISSSIPLRLYRSSKFTRAISTIYGIR
ncbi:MAG: VTC domain-containing protein [bacterium]